MNGYSTTDYTTTGFYMKSRNEEAQNVTINCKASEGETGAIIKPFMPDERGKVILETELITSPTGTPNITYQIRLPRIDPHMSISSVNSENGEFYIQYFFLAERRFSN
uniref:Ig-like domain-containing protein n=1 Tax=Caenorhabditis tropicalis TaxID=1561998 RepID=A0A1I7UBG8_9PELO